MHGSVWEWCQTSWRAYPYRDDDGRKVTPERKRGEVQDPKSLLDAHVLRGGSWHHGAKAAASFHRAASRPAEHRYYYGLRVVMSVTK